MNNIFKVITPDGRALWFGFTRRDGDKELFEANESARLYKDGEVIADNFDVFPLEPEEKSAWIPVGERLPRIDPEYEVSMDLLFVASRDIWKGYYNGPMKVWRSRCGRDFTAATHWQSLPALP